MAFYYQYIFYVVQICIYDKEICSELLKAFVYDDFYEVVNPGYSMIIMNVNRNILLKEDEGKISERRLPA